MFLVYTSRYPRGTAFWDQEELPNASNFFLDENDIWVLQPQVQPVRLPDLPGYGTEPYTDEEILPGARNYFRDENDIPWVPQYAAQYGVRFAYSDDELLPNAINVFNDEADIFWVGQTQTWWPGGYLVAPDLEETLGFVVFPGDDEYLLDFPSRRWVTRAYTRPVDEVWVPNIFGDEDYKLDLFWQRWLARTDVVSDDEAIGFVAAFDEDYWLSWPTTTWPAGSLVTDDEILANAKNFGLEDGLPRLPQRQRWPLNQWLRLDDDDALPLLSLDEDYWLWWPSQLWTSGIVFSDDELLVAQQFTITGITRDCAGTGVVGFSTVLLFRTSDKVFIGSTTSDVNGTYSFTVSDNTTQYWLRAIDPSGNLVGTTRNDVTGS